MDDLMKETAEGVALPFVGTALGAAAVFFMRGTLSDLLRRGLSGFAAGVMVAASVWSLLIPAMERNADMGAWAFIPAAAGFWIGVLFLMGIDKLIPRLQRAGENSVRRTAMMALAVVLHNLPEGMAVGVVYAARLEGGDVTAAAALALSLGIAIQNFPEGAIISMPLRAEGVSKGRSFAYGVLSGAVEPIGAALTILAASFITAALPALLSFAAGAMIYVVVEELIPEMGEGRRSDIPAVMFALGFTVMMALDVALG